MRRKEREITDQALMESILTRAQICRLGLCQDNTPYVVPVSFGRKGNRLYVHSSLHGKKVDMIKANNNVCFELEVDVEVARAETACDWSMKFYSVIGFGKAFFVQDPEEKIEGLNAIMEHYTGAPRHEYSERALEKVGIIRIDIESMTGKKAGY
ncbi:MAG: pyridoxamine 5'-phosphate oxidase family protein [Deltaproteobacteria bacterium]|nr:pyridoxamine 5'-phosphate oxidase family protein [Deltaproteobacteria bacterium]